MITEKRFKYKMIHPITGEYLAITLYDDEALVRWKPYLDKIEEWFIKQRLDKTYNDLLIK